MTKTLTNGYSTESTQEELSIEYQYERVYIAFKNICVIALLTKVALALEGLSSMESGIVFLLGLVNDIPEITLNLQ